MPSAGLPERSLHRRWREAREDWRRRAAARLVGDRDYLSRLYRRQFGRRPDLDAPRGFNEKILVKILHDRRAYLTAFADKLRVRGHVAATAPALACPALYWWSARADALPFAALPDAFALKANHGSGWNILVARKAEVRRDDLVAAARRWLRSDFTIVGREWSYRNVHRAVYAEALLAGPDGASPPDCKLFVFNGRVRVVQVDAGRQTHHTQVLYDEHWNPIEGTVAAAPGRPPPPPSALPTMIAAAEALSLGVDFVRVDLYERDGVVWFGELTNSPNKGLSPFRPATLDRRFGDLLTLDDYTRPGPAVAYSAAVDVRCALPRADDDRNGT
jgi:hypothetical protein